ncbi:MAG: cadmium-translocating P-type ATPase [Peptococcaceae bacterium]|nr:cadmium-translocating P-type ATPase [Peptococcaceae bacterium]
MKYILEGLDCANCAAKIERELNKVEGLSNASVNFATRAATLDPEFEAKAQEIINRIEPGVKLLPAEEAGKPGNRPSIEEENENSKRHLIRIIATTLLFIGGMIFKQVLHNTPYAFGEYMVFMSAYLLVGGPVVWKAVKNIRRGQVFDENFLLTVATAGAIAIHQIPEAVGVMLFFAVGEFFQDLAVNCSRRSISALMDVRPDCANLVIDGKSRKVSPEEVTVGQLIEVKPGEKVPLDGVVVEGSSFVDTSALTGESIPRRVEPGEEILSGVINGSGLLKVKVTRKFKESSVSKILELVENAASRKAPTEKFITRFAGWYTPAVVFGAVAVAIVPPLVIPQATFAEWIYRALILLVISCPCALVISIPLGYFGGVGGASRAGILVKGANFLDALTRVHTAVFDKTGTLTKGVFKVSRVVTKNGFTEDEVLRWAAMAEVHSSHPIAKSVLEAYKGEVDPGKVKEYQEIKGHGVKATVGGKTILAGNDRLLHVEGVKHDDCDVAGTVVYVAVDGVFAGYLIIADEIKEDTAQALAQLKKLGVKQTVMLTGDDKNVAARVAQAVGVDTYFAELLPQDKVSKVEEIEKDLRTNNDAKLVFVGDGINDAPVITRADIGVAMGALGSDAAIEAADVVLMDDSPSKLAKAIQIARYTRKIVTQNIVFALGVKGLFVALGVLGLATLWEAVFADVGVALIAIFNATRTLRYARVSS